MASLFQSPFGKPPLGDAAAGSGSSSSAEAGAAADASDGAAGVVEVATGDGRVLRKQLTDKTAATLLEMMAAVKRG